MWFNAAKLHEEIKFNGGNNIIIFRTAQACRFNVKINFIFDLNCNGSYKIKGLNNNFKDKYKNDVKLLNFKTS